MTKKLLCVSVFLLGFSNAFAQLPRALQEKRDLAIRSLQIIGADVPGSTRRCAQCHSLGEETVRKWGSRASSIVSCLASIENPKQKLQCFFGTEPMSPRGAQRLGLFAAGVHLDQVKNLFQAAFGETGEAEHQRYASTSQMPPAGHTALPPVTADEFTTLLKWISLGMPDLDVLLGGVGEAPLECKELAPTDTLVAHLSTMRTQGWGAVNSRMRLPMFGCTKHNRPTECLSGMPAAPYSKADMHPHASARLLTSFDFATAYWVRTSPDGRFVAGGLAKPEQLPGVVDRDGSPVFFSGFAMDLAKPGRKILLNKPYDPGFFPDNSGIHYAGGNFCPLDLLKFGNRTHLLFTEPGCTSVGNVGVYQSSGTSLDSVRLLTVSGVFAGDRGNVIAAEQDNRFRDRTPGWLSDAHLDLTWMLFTGRTFEQDETEHLKTPYKGDWQLSPSAKLLVNRVSGKSADGTRTMQQGYEIHLLKSGANGTELELGARFCGRGGKAIFSYDERFVAYHHWVEAADAEELGYRNIWDPDFQALLNEGSANIYVADLLTGRNRRVTRMGPGQAALFPHFRSDGWLSYQVSDTKAGVTHIVATDDVIWTQ